MRVSYMLILLALGALLVFSSPPEPLATWTPAEEVGIPLNSAYDERHPCLSVGGDTIFFVSNRPPSVSSDIWMATWNPMLGMWNPPVPLPSPVNTDTTTEEGPYFVQDSVLYFASNRPGSMGHTDIWMSVYRNTKWTDPVNQLPLNCPCTDARPFVTPDGMTMVFASERDPSLGGFDIWQSTKVGDMWLPPLSLPPPVNSPGIEHAPSLYDNGNSLYFDTDRENPPWMMDMCVSYWRGSYWSDPIKLGLALNSGSDESGFRIVGDIAYFCSTRPGGQGGSDIWRTRWIEPMVVAKSANDDAIASNNARRAVRDGQGRFHLVFESGDEVMYTMWSPWQSVPPRVMNLSRSPEIDSRNPAIAIGPAHDRLSVVWCEMIGTGEIYYTESTDWGWDWSDPVNISLSQWDGSTLPAIDIGSDDETHVVWQETFGGEGIEQSLVEVYYTSKGLLHTWTAPISISDATPMESMKPSIATAVDFSSPILHVVWEDHSPSPIEDPSPYIAYRNHDPIGNTWTPTLDMPPARVSGPVTGTWPSVAVCGCNVPHVVWQTALPMLTSTDTEVYYSYGSAPPGGFAPPEMLSNTTEAPSRLPVIAVGQGCALDVAWAEGDGEIVRAHREVAPVWESWYLESFTAKSSMNPSLVTKRVGSPYLPGYDLLWNEETGDADPAYKILCLHTSSLDPTGIDPGRKPGAIDGLVLHAFPVPFSTNTQISFVLDDEREGELAVYNVNGQRVATLLRGRLQAGPHVTHWDGRDRAGARLAGGIYFLRLTTEKETGTRKVVLLR